MTVRSHWLPIQNSFQFLLFRNPLHFPVVSGCFIYKFLLTTHKTIQKCFHGIFFPLFSQPNRAACLACQCKTPWLNAPWCNAPWCNSLPCWCARRRRRYCLPPTILTMRWLLLIASLSTSSLFVVGRVGSLNFKLASRRFIIIKVRPSLLFSSSLCLCLLLPGDLISTGASI